MAKFPPNSGVAGTGLGFAPPSKCGFTSPGTGFGHTRKSQKFPVSLCQPLWAGKNTFEVFKLWERVRGQKWEHWEHPRGWNGQLPGEGAALR